ncbi:MAG: AAA family ATPase [Kofleriaceae bacterium]|nr:MAG: AAA family ATPase [Kofleriaceae bacterium]MBZ0231964.1 zeta toxin family protein [Kofleriaceae bacterium]
MRPVLLVIAGPNGAGKTTLTQRLKQDRWSEGVEYLNPDEIARDRFGDWNSPEAVRQAAIWTTARREELLAGGAGIAFETVFSADDKVEFLLRARETGYFIRVFYVSTSDPRINAARVAGRVMAGGHSVPIEKIVSRYARSMSNLSAAIEIADRTYIYDNSIDDADATLCARTFEGQLRKIYGELPAWVAACVSGLERHPTFVDLRAS